MIGLDLQTGEESTYHVDKINILCTAVNQDYIFAGSNLNGVSYLSRIEREEGIEEDLAFENEYLSSLAATDHYVFAFLSSTDYENMYAKINIYDVDSLVLEKSIDITEYGINQAKNCISQDKLYFSNAYDKHDQRTNILGILDLHDFSLAKVELELNSPDDIQIVDENKLLIACTNIVLTDGTHLVMYEKDTGKQTIYDLGNPISNI